MRITSKRVLKISMNLFSLFITLLVGIYSYQALRNYYGYCRITGKKYSTQERLDIAINKYLKEQKTADIHEIAEAKKRTNRQYYDYRNAARDFDLIYYKNVDEFLRENPDCCELTWGLVEGDQFGFFQRVDGKGNGMFDFKHKIRYRNKNGNYEEMMSSRTYYLVYNCGFPRLRSYF